MPKLNKRTVCCVGIDPGANGGLAILHPDGHITLTELSKLTKRDIFECLDLTDATYEKRTQAFIEWIHPAIQGIGKSSMSKLYGSYMELQMALLAANIPFETVQPRKWQVSFGIPPRKGEATPKWKRRLKEKAEQLFPGVKITLATSDALLIAEYCRRTRQ